MSAGIEPEKPGLALGAARSDRSLTSVNPSQGEVD